MVKKTAEATAKVAYGKTLETPIVYTYGWDEYESYGEVASANDLLTNDEVKKVRNDERKSLARQKAQSAAFDAAGIVKPDINNDPQLRLKNMAAILVASGQSEAEARKNAAVMLNTEWDDQ